MPQRVEYESLPGTRFDQYVFKLRLVLSSLQAGNTKFKAFRDFLRKQNLWDKERSETLFSLVDIGWDKSNVKVGRVAKKLMGASSDADFQNILFDHLRDQNILLVKYVLEALDVESGGRLHSVHELYRMITSYVYPGARITLTNFQSWMDWLAASGFIKLVGIRWALSDKGMKVVNELKGMDVEEILEDMAEEDEEEEEDDDAVAEAEEEDDDAPASKRVTDADLDDEEDLFADLPPEAEPPSEDDIAAATNAFTSTFDDVPGTSAEVLAPVAPSRRKAALSAVPARPGSPAARVGAPVAAPAGAPASLQMPFAAREWPAVATVSLDDPDTAALAARITGWFQALSGWPVYDARSLGVEVDPAASELALLVELGTLAALIEGLPPQPAVFAFVRRLRQTTFFASLGYGEGLEECLDALERTGGEPWGRALFERIVHSRFIARRASMRLDLMPALRGATSGPELIALLREHLLGTHWVEAPFWVARELVRLGVLDTAAAKSVACVPSRRLLANAARIGLVPRPEIQDFQTLLALVEQVAGLFGAEAGYGRALEQLDFALGLKV